MPPTLAHDPSLMGSRTAIELLRPVLQPCYQHVASGVIACETAPHG
jgi:hypothetical protein